MGGLVQKGLIRGWGMCNDNAYGLMGSIAASHKQGGALRSMSGSATVAQGRPRGRLPVRP